MSRTTFSQFKAMPNDEKIEFFRSLESKDLFAFLLSETDTPKVDSSKVDDLKSNSAKAEGLKNDSPKTDSSKKEEPSKAEDNKIPVLFQWCLNLNNLAFLNEEEKRAFYSNLFKQMIIAADELNHIKGLQQSDKKNNTPDGKLAKEELTESRPGSELFHKIMALENDDKENGWRIVVCYAFFHLEAPEKFKKIININYFKRDMIKIANNGTTALDHLYFTFSDNLFDIFLSFFDNKTFNNVMALLDKNKMTAWARVFTSLDEKRLTRFKSLLNRTDKTQFNQAMSLNDCKNMTGWAHAVSNFSSGEFSPIIIKIMQYCLQQDLIDQKLFIHGMFIVNSLGIQGWDILMHTKFDAENSDTINNLVKMILPNDDKIFKSLHGEHKSSLLSYLLEKDFSEKIILSIVNSVDKKKFNEIMLLKDNNGLCGWHRLTSVTSLDIIQSFLEIADAKLYNNAMLEEKIGWFSVIQHQTTVKNLGAFLNLADIELFNIHMIKNFQGYYLNYRGNDENVWKTNGWAYASFYQSFEGWRLLLSYFNPLKYPFPQHAAELLEKLVDDNNKMNADDKRKANSEFNSIIELIDDPLTAIQRDEKEFFSKISHYIKLVSTQEDVHQWKEIINNKVFDNYVREKYSIIIRKICNELAFMEGKIYLKENAKNHLPEYYLQARFAFLNIKPVDVNPILLSFQNRLELGLHLIDGMLELYDKRKNKVEIFKKIDSTPETVLLSSLLSASCHDLYLDGLEKLKDALFPQQRDDKKDEPKQLASPRFFSSSLVTNLTTKDVKKEEPMQQEKSMTSIQLVDLNANENEKDLFRACLGINIRDNCNTTQIEQKFMAFKIELILKYRGLNSSWIGLSKEFKHILESHNKKSIEHLQKKSDEKSTEENTAIPIDFLLKLAKEKMRYEWLDNQDEKEKEEVLANMLNIIKEAINKLGEKAAACGISYVHNIGNSNVLIAQLDHLKNNFALLKNIQSILEKIKNNKEPIIALKKNTMSS